MGRGAGRPQPLSPSLLRFPAAAAHRPICYPPQPSSTRRVWATLPLRALQVGAGPSTSRLATVVDTFTSISDPKDKYRALVEYARQLPAFAEAHKTPRNRVLGCTAQVGQRRDLLHGRALLWQAHLGGWVLNQGYGDEGMYGGTSRGGHAARLAPPCKQVVAREHRWAGSGRIALLPVGPTRAVVPTHVRGTSACGPCSSLQLRLGGAGADCSCCPPCLPRLCRGAVRAVCRAQVWMTAELDGAGRVQFAGTSDSELSKGVCGLLASALSGLTPQEVAQVRARARPHACWRVLRGGGRRVGDEVTGVGAGNTGRGDGLGGAKNTCQPVQEMRNARTPSFASLAWGLSHGHWATAATQGGWDSSTDGASPGALHGAPRHGPNALSCRGWPGRLQLADGNVPTRAGPLTPATAA